MMMIMVVAALAEAVAAVVAIASAPDCPAERTQNDDFCIEVRIVGGPCLVPLIRITATWAIYRAALIYGNYRT